MGKHRFQSIPNVLSTNSERRSGVFSSDQMQNSVGKLENFADGKSDLEGFLGSLSESWIDKFSNNSLSLGDNLYSYHSSLDQDRNASEGGLWWVHEGGVRLLVHDDARSHEVSIVHLTAGMPFVPIYGLIQGNIQSDSIEDLAQINSAFSSYRVVASRDTVLAYLDSESLQLLLQKSDQLTEYFLAQWQFWKSQLDTKQSNDSKS